MACNTVKESFEISAHWVANQNLHPRPGQGQRSSQTGKHQLHPSEEMEMD